VNPFQFDMALQRPVFYIMRRGFKVDKKKKLEFGKEAHEEWARFQVMINDLRGGNLNVSSPKQVQAYLYGKSELGLPPRRKKGADGKSHITADEDALRSIMADAEYKTKTYAKQTSIDRWMRVYLSTKVILKVRGARKALGSYLGCPPECTCNKPSSIRFDDDGRMRCTLAVGGTETMRFAHSKTAWGTGLNLATIPHKYRQMYVADDGYVMGEFDLNRGESWVYAYLSMDPELIRILTNGLDFHAETAAAIQTAFGESSMTAEGIAKGAKVGDFFSYKLRFLGKKDNHASAYRMGPFRGAEVVNQEADDTNITITVAQMKKAQKLWLSKYSGMINWWTDIDATLEECRQLVTPFGRVRNFYGPMNDATKKEATAYVPQSTCVDYLNHGMLKVYDELVAPRHYKLELLHQNHDSIIVQWPEGYDEKKVIGEIKSRLESTVHINGHDITIPVEASIGKNWGDYHPERNPEGLKEVA